MEVKVLMIVIVILILVCGLLLMWAIIAHFAFLEMKRDRNYWKFLSDKRKERLLGLFKDIGI